MLPGHSVKIYFLLPPGVEVKMLNWKKAKTAIVGSFFKPGSQPEICKVSDDGKRISGNLRDASYCRLCGSVEPDYANAFSHSAEFKCIKLLPHNAVTCPLCVKEFTVFNKFFVHMSSHKKDFIDHINYKNIPKEDQNNQSQINKARQKALIMLWMLLCCLKLSEGRSSEAKMFLPHMSSTMLAVQHELKNLQLCPWTVCICLNGTTIQHEHKHETLGSGRCSEKKCNNFHHSARPGTEGRGCKFRGFKGVIPL